MRWNITYFVENQTRKISRFFHNQYCKDDHYYYCCYDFIGKRPCYVLLQLISFQYDVVAACQRKYGTNQLCWSNEDEIQSKGPIIYSEHYTHTMHRKTRPHIYIKLNSLYLHGNSIETNIDANIFYQRAVYWIVKSKWTTKMMKKKKNEWMTVIYAIA